MSMIRNNIVSTPWVEKYRPTDFGDIVLNDINKQICNNIVNTEYFPNLLFYGPPGTGKTTTIINLVTSYQRKVSKVNKEEKSLMIHLNASDDRGIDIIRNQILQFVNSKCLFTSGLKFVILDEVDYMTKNAQQALRYLINTHSSNVRFCLICNYISRIDDGLQTEFLKIRFNNLPQLDIGRFLKNIVVSEQLTLTDSNISAIQKLYGSDIRSMINFIQCNHILDTSDVRIIDNAVWEHLTTIIKSSMSAENTTSLSCTYFQKGRDIVSNHLRDISTKYNITFKNIIKDYFTHLIKYRRISVTREFLLFIEKLVHTTESTNSGFVNYALVNLGRFSNLL